MKHLIGLCFVLVLLHQVSATPNYSHPKQQGDSYIAAAVQFSPSGTYTDPPLQVISESVDRFEPFVSAAKLQQGAQIIVFPEGGLGMFNAEAQNTRDAMFPYCVEVGEVGQGYNPCNLFHGVSPPSSNSSMYQLWRSSCLAQNYSIILAVNLCETKPCANETDPNCPADGRYQWNTELVFDEQGTLVLKYHKAHLFGGSAVFDQAAPVPQKFKSSFGVTFGTFICFDILYQSPAADLVESGVTDFIFSSFWVNPNPSTDAVMQQQAWSRLYGVNLIAANAGVSDGNSGGGIYSSGEVLIDTFVPKSQNLNEMNVAKVPILSKQKQKQRHAKQHNKAHYAHDVTTKTAMSLEDIITYQPCQPNIVFAGLANCTIIDASSLKKAAKHLGMDITSPVNIPVSYGNVSCSLNVSFDSIAANEPYVIFAYEGIQTFPYTPSPLSLQVCAIHHCVPASSTAKSKKHKHHVVAQGNGNLVCLPSWDAYQSILGSVSMQGLGFAQDAKAFPMLGVANGQTDQDILDTDFSDEQQDGARVIQWGTSARFKPQSLFSAMIYGVRPDH